MRRRRTQKLPLLKSAKEGTCRNLTCIYFYSPAIIANRLTGGSDGITEKRGVLSSALSSHLGGGGGVARRGELNRPHRAAMEPFVGMVADGNRKEQDAEVHRLACAALSHHSWRHVRAWLSSFATRLPGYSLFVPLRRANTHTSPRLTPQTRSYCILAIALLTPHSGCQDNPAD